MYFTVRLDIENNRFYIKNNGRQGELRFNKISPKLFQLNFLNVAGDLDPTELEDELLYTAFLFAQKEGIKIIPACEKVTQYLDRHKEFNCVTYQEPITA